MNEIKLNEPSTIPEPDDAIKQQSGATGDPGQTQLLPPTTANVNQDIENRRVIDANSVHSKVEESKPSKEKPSSWFKKLSQSSIIGISLTIVLVFFMLFFLLIAKARQKNKSLRSISEKQLAEASKTNSAVDDYSKNKFPRQAASPMVVLTDDEFAGKAPMAVKVSGPVISAAIDPELAAMVDALKIRLKIFEDSKETIRGNVSTKVTKGEFRGFKINVDEKIDNQNTVSETIAVITPQKGFIKTINGVLEFVKDTDLGRFSVELQNSGLEIARLPLQPENKVVQVQFKSINVFGKPIADEYLISGKSVGKIFLGMPTAQLENLLLASNIILKRKVLVNDVYYDVYKILDQSNEPLFYIYENKGRVWGISIISEIFKTEKGIGIGSSLGNVRINYPRIKVGISEKKTPFVQITDEEGLFVIQSEGIDINKHIFPNKTKIISILLGNSPEFE